MKLSIDTFESSYCPSLVITILAEMDSKRFLKVMRFSHDVVFSIFGVCYQSCCQNLVNIALTDRELQHLNKSQDLNQCLFNQCILSQYPDVYSSNQSELKFWLSVFLLSKFDPFTKRELLGRKSVSSKVTRFYDNEVIRKLPIPLNLIAASQRSCFSKLAVTLASFESDY